MIPIFAIFPVIRFRQALRLDSEVTDMLTTHAVLLPVARTIIWRFAMLLTTLSTYGSTCGAGCRFVTWAMAPKTNQSTLLVLTD